MASEKKISEVNLQFGKNLTALRKKAGLTRKQLAEILNVTEMAVGTYERGIRTPNLDKILQLTNLFKVSTDDLLKNDTAEKISSGVIKFVMAVGKRKVEFDILPHNEPIYSEILKVTTKLVESILQNAEKKEREL